MSATPAAPQAPRAIVFSHANGFPAGTYRALFDEWRRAGWRVVAPEKLGHDPRFPVTSNWPHLRDELLNYIDEQRAAPAYLVGHSLGGYLSLLAAAHRPGIARGIVLLDSPLLPNWMGRTIQFFKATGVGERFSPGHVSKRRRDSWPSLQAAREHFAGKPMFACWAEGVLDDYLRCGLMAGENAQHLSFKRDVETRIYNTLPHHLTRMLRAHPLPCPVAFVGGEDSTELERVGLREVKRVTHSRITFLPGSHLFPMEDPKETARAVAHWLAEFDKACDEASSAPTPHL